MEKLVRIDRLVNQCFGIKRNVRGRSAEEERQWLTHKQASEQLGLFEDR